MESSDYVGGWGLSCLITEYYFSNYWWELQSTTIQKHIFDVETKIFGHVQVLSEKRKTKKSINVCSCLSISAILLPNLQRPLCPATNELWTMFLIVRIWDVQQAAGRNLVISEIPTY